MSSLESLPSMGDILRNNALRRANKTALIFKERKYKWSEFNSRVNRLAHAMMNEGVGHGDVVSVIGLNTPEYLETYFACAKLGATMLATNLRLAPPEIVNCIKNSKAKMLILDADLQPLFPAISGELPFKQVIVMDGDVSIEIGISYDNLIKDQPTDEPEVEVIPTDPVLLLYTSGTTGLPKGALITQLNWLFDSLVYLYEFEIKFKDILLQAMPFFHVSGLHIFTDAFLLKGSPIIIQKRWDPEPFCDLVQRHRPTFTQVLVPLLPSLLEFLDKAKDSGTLDYDFSSLNMILLAAGAYNKEMVEKVAYYTGVDKVIFGYGMTETSPAVSMTYSTGETLSKENCLGWPIWHSKVRIVDAEGEEVEIGEPGELLVKGPGVFKEYMGMEEVTKQTVVDGWMHTGDIVRIDEDGCLFFMGRRKDMIKTGGENVYAPEVEEVLVKENPNIMEAAVYGIPDPKWGEAVAASIILREETSLTPEQIITNTKKVLAGFKTPKYLRIVNEFPRSASGKVQKFLLAKDHQAELG